MQLLKERIKKEGRIVSGQILKVDSFLNHQIDIDLYNEIGKEFKMLFSDVPVTKILTIESSGIGIACITAQYFGVPVVFAKKAKSKNIDGEVLTSRVDSYTYEKSYEIMVSSKFIKPEDKILIIDDFLAKGKAIIGLNNIVNSAGASVSGVGIVIEKGFQEGGNIIRQMGLNLHSLAVLDKIEENGDIVFK